MSVSLSRLSWWNWSNGKEISNGSTSDTMKLCSKKKKESSKKKWKSEEERKRVTVVDKEYDLVLVPSDDGEESSYDSDWSIGWMEPHAPDFFQSDDDFAVLVPCYRNDCKATFKMEEVQQQQEQSNHFLNVLTSFPAVDGNKYMNQWLASLQNF